MESTTAEQRQQIRQDLSWPNFPRTQTLAKEKGQYARIKNARVLRVDRKQMLNAGSIGIAVEFDE